VTTLLFLAPRVNWWQCAPSTGTHLRYLWLSFRY